MNALVRPQYGKSLFTKPSIPSNRVFSKSLDLGGQGDCGFRAMAAALVDLAQVEGRQPLQQMLLKLFRTYHEQLHLKLKEGKLNLQPEHVQNLNWHNLTHWHVDKAIAVLAYALRQLSCQCILQDPKRYPGAFVRDLGLQTDPFTMSKPYTWVQSTYFVAILDWLNTNLERPVSLRIEKKDAPGDLPVIIGLGSSDSKVDSTTAADMCLELVGNAHYLVKLPKVHLPMSCVDYEVQETTKPADDAFIETMLATFDVAVKETQVAYEAAREHLEMLLCDDAGKSRAMLLDTYIQSINPEQDYLRGRQEYFPAELKAHLNAVCNKQALRDPRMLSDHGISELVHALAMAHAIGEVDLNETLAVSGGPRAVL